MNGPQMVRASFVPMGTPGRPGPENPAEDEFVGGLRAGSPQVLQEVMAVYRPRLHAQALRLSGNHHDAEEIVQEAFVRAFRAAPRFRREASLGTWLHTITTNLARNRYHYWRRRQRHATISLDATAPGEDRPALLEAIAVDAATAAGEAEQNDLVQRIERGMARLAPRDRQVLLLRNGQHASYAETARALGITMGTVKSRIARARERLRVFVKDDTAMLRKAG